MLHQDWLTCLRRLPLLLLWRVFAAALLTICYYARTLLVPTTAGMGAALILAASAAADEIILNSLAMCVTTRARFELASNSGDQASACHRTTPPEHATTPQLLLCCPFRCRLTVSTSIESWFGVHRSFVFEVDNLVCTRLPTNSTA